VNFKRMVGGILGVTAGFWLVDLVAGTAIRGMAGTWGYPVEAGIAYVVTDAINILDWAEKLLK
jgi:hypothetical protein